MSHMVDVRYLSGTPLRFGDYDGIGTALDDLRNRIAKTMADVLDPPLTAGVFTRIV
jgi:hypothetical protein